MLRTKTYNSHQIESELNITALDERFGHVCIFDSNTDDNPQSNSRFSKLVAIGCIEELAAKPNNNLETLQAFIDKHRKQWLFGFLSYDLKNEIERLSSKNSDGLHFPSLHFFVPEVVIQITDKKTDLFLNDDSIDDERADFIFKTAFSKSSENNENTNNSQPVNVLPRITKEEYTTAVNSLKNHIKQGDIYEINFCQEFYANNANINSDKVYENLNSLSKAPFTAFYKHNNNYLMCASPERFIKKNANQLLSQPIKGTAKRSSIKEEDELLKNNLKLSEKERSENVMIVDLVRNDLSKIAKRGTVHVDELFGVYTFKQVHQLISSVSCTVKDDISFTEILKSTFPMGSMTGAPKVSAMQLIEKYESTKRGLYSGSVGYISPTGDFDFNVVIRSILFNQNNEYLSFMVGSAITDKSNSENEYEECLIKAKALFEALK